MNLGTANAGPAQPMRSPQDASAAPPTVVSASVPTVVSDADFTEITELPGSLLSGEQWARIHHRYSLARQLGHNRRILEVACGAGMGLPALAAVGRRVVGGDYTAHVLTWAQRMAHARPPAEPVIGLTRFDAHALPFCAAAFDLVLCFEAIYYLHDPRAFLEEARRVLAPGGNLLIGSTNPRWPDFVPGRLSTRYWAADALHGLLAEQGFDAIQSWGAFPVSGYPFHRRQIGKLRRFLSRHNLIPSHPLIRRALLRLGYGALHTLPAALAEAELGHAPVTPLATRRDTGTENVAENVAENVDTDFDRGFKVIYVLGRAPDKTID